MRALNPGYLKTVTAPKGSHKVVVPLARAEALKVALNVRLADLAPSHKRAVVAQADTEQRQHRVEKGESLSVIAERYDVTVEALAELNDVNPKRLKLGQTLLVPVSASRPADSGDTTVAVAEASGDGVSPPADAKRTVHTVRAGDSLWTIARSHDVRVKNLVAWNAGLTPKSVLQINQKIVVFNSGTEDAELIAETTAIKPVSVTLPSDGTFKLVRYQIQYGDSLWTIAQRFKVSIDQLRLWNGLPERSILQPGDNIDVYVVSTDRPDSGLQI
jgi:membrane-bound lytic murein transglycosylase D